jgi:hypothetical protein
MRLMIDNQSDLCGYGHEIVVKNVHQFAILSGVAERLRASYSTPNALNTASTGSA